MKCAGCFKPAFDTVACMNCAMFNVHEFLRGFPESSEMDLETIEEVEFELINGAHPKLKVEEVDRMSNSMLRSIVAKCSDTAIYLNRKKHGLNSNPEDMACVLFDLELNSAFITNGDCVINIYDLDMAALDGLCREMPAYDYMTGHFIPNPLPYDIPDLMKVFDVVSNFVVTIPVNYVLEKIHRSYPQPISRRDKYAVLDVGYGYFAGSILIPFFEEARDGKKYCSLPHLNKTILIHKDSRIGAAFIEPNVAYVGLPVSEEEGGIVYLDVYKKFQNTTTIGMYDTAIPYMDDDIHPFDLEMYAECDLVQFSLSAMGVNLPTRLDTLNYFRNFYPIVMDAEFFYEILLLYSSFGYEYVNMFISAPDLPLVMSGVKTEGSTQPTIDTTLGVIILGDPGISIVTERCD